MCNCDGILGVKYICENIGTQTSVHILKQIIQHNITVSYMAEMFAAANKEMRISGTA